MTTTPDDEVPATIAELFARDPLSLTRNDISTIVVKLRTQRERFAAGIKDAGTPALRVSQATKNQAAAAAVIGDASAGLLDDLL